MMDVREMASLGQDAMRKQRSAAEKVFWPLQAGRPRQSKPTLIEAVHLGRSTANRLFDAVSKAGLHTDQAGCALVCAVGGKVFPTERFSFENQDSSDLDMARAILNSKGAPIGVVFFLTDLDKGKVLIHARTFQRDAEHKRMVESALDRWAFEWKTGASLRAD